MRPVKSSFIAVIVAIWLGATALAPQAAAPTTPAEAFAELGPLKGRTGADIINTLNSKDWKGIAANGGGMVFTKDLGNGTTAVVRVDPAHWGGRGGLPAQGSIEVYSSEKGILPTRPGIEAQYDPQRADAVGHVHKESVPTSEINGVNKTKFLPDGTRNPNFGQNAGPGNYWPDAPGKQTYSDANVPTHRPVRMDFPTEDSYNKALDEYFQLNHIETKGEPFAPVPVERTPPPGGEGTPGRPNAGEVGAANAPQNPKGPNNATCTLKPWVEPPSFGKLAKGTAKGVALSSALTFMICYRQGHTTKQCLAAVGQSVPETVFLAAVAETGPLGALVVAGTGLAEPLGELSSGERTAEAALTDARAAHWQNIDQFRSEMNKLSAQVAQFEKQAAAATDGLCSKIKEAAETARKSAGDARSALAELRKQKSCQALDTPMTIAKTIATDAATARKSADDTQTDIVALRAAIEKLAAGRSSELTHIRNWAEAFAPIFGLDSCNLNDSYQRIIDSLYTWWNARLMVAARACLAQVDDLLTGARDATRNAAQVDAEGKTILAKLSDSGACQPAPPPTASAAACYVVCTYSDGTRIVRGKVEHPSKDMLSICQSSFTSTDSSHDYDIKELSLTRAECTGSVPPGALWAGPEPSSEPIAEMIDGGSQSPECIVAQNAVADAQANVPSANFPELREAFQSTLDDAKAKAHRICNTPTKTATLELPPPGIVVGTGDGAPPPTPARGNQSPKCIAAQNAVTDAKAGLDTGIVLAEAALRKMWGHVTVSDLEELHNIAGRDALHVYLSRMDSAGRIVVTQFLEPLVKKLDDAKAEAQRICNTPTETATVMPPPPPPTPTATPVPGNPDCTQQKKACLVAMESYEKAAHITFDFPLDPDVSFCVNQYLAYANVDLPQLRQPLTEWGSARAAYLKCSRNDSVASTAKMPVRRSSPTQGPGPTDSQTYATQGPGPTHSQTYVDRPSGGSVGIATIPQPVPNDPICQDKTFASFFTDVCHPLPSVGGDTGSGGSVDMATIPQSIPNVCQPLPSVGGDNGSGGSVGTATIPPSVGGATRFGRSVGMATIPPSVGGDTYQSPSPPTIPRTSYSRPRYIPRYSSAHRGRAGYSNRYGHGYGYSHGYGDAGYLLRFGLRLLGRYGSGGSSGGHPCNPSDIRLKHGIALLGRLDNGLGFYRFSYNGSNKVYVGVMAQEVQSIKPEAVVRGRDGYLRVYYERLGLHLQTWDQWLASGQRIPAGTD